MDRMKTKEVQIGNRVIGGDHPILIQSMCNTKTEDVEATVAQILQLEQAGCDIIRVAASMVGTAPRMISEPGGARVGRPASIAGALGRRNETCGSA